MSKVKAKNTKPEIIVRKFLFSKGLRFRLYGDLPGTPDIVLRKYKTVVEVRGCFWHSHGEGCKKSTVPKSRKDFWIQKLRKNKLRDIDNEEKLRSLGWRVLIVWECELRNSIAHETLTRLHKNIINHAN